MGEKEIEEKIIKDIFQVTLNENEKKQYVYLSRLDEQLKALHQFQFNFDFSQFQIPGVSNPSTSSHSSNELIPCDLCGQLVSFDAFLHHSNVCGNSRTSQQTSNPPPNISRTTIPKQITSDLLDAVVDERLNMFSGIQGVAQSCKFLIESYQRMISFQEKNKGQFVSILEKSRKKIFESLKHVLLREQIQLQQYPYPQDSISQSVTLLEYIPFEFLKYFIDTLNDEELSTIFAPFLNQIAVEFQKSVRGKNMLENSFIIYLKSFFNFSQNPRLLNLLVNIMKIELEKSRTSTAREIELFSTLGAFMTLSAIISPFDPKAFNYFQTLITGYPNSRREVDLLKDNLRVYLRQAQECIHSILKQLLLLKQRPEAKELTMQWLTNLLQLNDARLSLNLNDPLFMEMSFILSTDGFILNLISILIKFCQPFVDPKVDKLSSVELGYLSSSKRFNFTKQPKLADPIDKMQIESKENFNFITECFFLTYYGLYIGFLPSISILESYFTMYSQTKTAIDSLKAKLGPNIKNPELERLEMNWNRIHSFIDSLEVHILEPSFLEGVANFCLFAMKWMLQLDLPKYGAEPNQKLRNLFATFPEFLVRVIADFLPFLFRFNSNIINNVPNLIQVTIDWAVSLLNQPVLVKSPIIRSKIVGVLCEIVYKKNTEQEHMQKNGLWMNFGSSYSFVFQENKRAQAELAPALMSIYVDVDVVEGLDVDKEKFDKYSIRRNINLLLNDLWDLPNFKNSFREQTKTERFSKFISTVVNDSIHLLEDSLGRLRDIRQLEIAMKDTNEWNSQDPEIKKERERYYEIQQNSARGFLSLANSILDLLSKLVKEDIMIKPFLEARMIARTEAMLTHFYDALCGPKCSNLKVDNPEKYNFSPKELLKKITLITLCFLKFDQFIQTMANDPDYSPDIMKQASHLLSRYQIIPDAQFKQFDQAVNKVNGFLNYSEDKMEDIATLLSDDGNTPEELEKIYLEELEEYLFDTVEMKDENEKYMHHYSSNILNSSATKEKMGRLTKECKQLATSLPLSLNSSIFVRADAERMDVMKALIVGPKDTPYSLGCFVFDIYFPPSYPLDPPLVNLQTTGNGTVRFNPNLYNCGKVCLSLLGTWHGDNQTTKWNPSTSSVYQVLVSIQAMILVEQPYFNEPAYEAQRGTKEGELRSSEYNENIRLAPTAEVASPSTNPK